LGVGATPLASSSVLHKKQSRCCPAARYWSWEGLIVKEFSTVRSCMSRLRGHGTQLPALTRADLLTRRRYSPTGRCWSSEGVTESATCGAPNFTTRKCQILPQRLSAHQSPA